MIRNVCFLCILGVSGVYAQGLTGQISGAVQDPSGASIADAEVVLTNVATAQARKIATSAEGAFLFTQLLPGTYQVEVTARGFQKAQQKDIVLASSERVALAAIVLAVGDITQTVEVVGESARVQTESAERSGLIDSRQLQDVALKGRDYLGMMKLLPGVIDTRNREAPGWNNLGGITINGNRAGTINLTLDGISSLDTGSMGGPYLAPSIDAVQEVKVLLTNYQAEYGRSSGGTINTVIKNGTRDFSGGAYYFHRNEAFNANEFFRNRSGLPRPYYRFHYPGYFFGGPVLIPGTSFNRNRDKLFFFWSQEFLPRKYPTALVQRTFPTALERQGDFSQTRDQNLARIPIWDPTSNRTPFPNNVIPVNRIDPVGRKLLEIFPLPTLSDDRFVRAGYNAEVQALVDQPRRDSILRIDYNFSPKTTFYWRGIQDYEAFKGDFNFVLASPSWAQLPINYQIRSVGSVATLIHTFSPTLVNEFTFGINRAKQTVDPLTQEGLERNQRDKIGLNLPQFFPASNPRNLVPNANFGGVPNAATLNIEQRFPFFGTNNIWNWSNNLSWIKDRHNIKTGIYIERTTRNAQRSAAFNSTFNFNRDVNNPFESNYAYSNAILGSVQNYTEANRHPQAHARYLNVEWFVQDQWKVSRRLTLDAGVRFYFIQPTWSAGDQLAAFDIETYDRNQQPQLIQPYINPANNTRVGRDPVSGELVSAAVIGAFASGRAPFQGMSIFNERIMNTPSIQTAPRLGFAYDVFGNGKTALRGGAGIFFDRFNDDQILQLVESPPLTQQPSATYLTIPSLLSTPLRLSPQGVFAVQRSFRPPTVYNWSFGIQQNIGWGVVFDAAYVGNVGRFQLQRRSLNATPYGTNFKPENVDPTTPARNPLPVNFLRPNPGFADIQYIEMASNSNYHSLQTQVNKRFSKGLLFGGAWTWSKSMNFVNGNNDAVNPYLDFRMRNYGRAANDRTHNFVLNYVYSIPALSSVVPNPVVKAIFDNWDISGISTFTSGQPLGVGLSFVNAIDLTGASGAGIDSRVNVIADPVLPKSERTFERNFNTDAFRPPSQTEFGIGNGAKDLFRGPGLQVHDISFFKNIPFSSDGVRRVQLRFEFYNMFNKTNFTTLDTTSRWTNATATAQQVNAQFGAFTAAADARRIVLGAKIYF